MKTDKHNIAAASSHISNDAENYLSKDMVKYIEHAVDPKHSPVALRPAPSGQYVGLCQKVPLLARGEFSVGTAGYGVLSVSPKTNMCCSDRALLTYSNGIYAGVGGNNVPSGAGGGISVAYPSKAPFEALPAGANGFALNGMVNACGVYIKPIGSATTQNGRIFLLEVPGHPYVGSEGITLDEVISHPRTRVIDAVQLGSPGFQNVLNWHPQTVNSTAAQGAGGDTNDNEFNTPAGTTSLLFYHELIIVVVGDAGTKYEYEIYSSYAMRGSRTQPTSPMYTDPLGWAAYTNAISDKRISGWVGTAGLASSIYKGFASKSARRLLPKSEIELEKARAKLDREKAQKLGKGSSGWYDTMKAMAPIAKDVGGFLLNLL